MEMNGTSRVVKICQNQSCGVNAVFICDHLPELGADLISALASLDVHELAHGFRRFFGNEERHRLLGYFEGLSPAYETVRKGLQVAKIDIKKIRIMNDLCRIKTIQIPMMRHLT